MFSKAMMQKVVQELPVPMLATLAREALVNVEAADEKGKEAVTNAEMIFTELKKRMFPPQPQAESTRRNRKAEGGQPQQ